MGRKKFSYKPPYPSPLLLIFSLQYVHKLRYIYDAKNLINYYTSVRLHGLFHVAYFSYLVFIRDDAKNEIGNI